MFEVTHPWDVPSEGVLWPEAWLESYDSTRTPAGRIQFLRFRRQILPHEEVAYQEIQKVASKASFSSLTPADVEVMVSLLAGHQYHALPGLEYRAHPYELLLALAEHPSLRTEDLQHMLDIQNVYPGTLASDLDFVYRVLQHPSYRPELLLSVLSDAAHLPRYHSRWHFLIEQLPEGEALRRCALPARHNSELQALLAQMRNHPASLSILVCLVQDESHTTRPPAELVQTAILLA